MRQAEHAARRGDLRDAERWAKNAQTLTEAMEQMAKQPAPVEDFDEAARAELLRRLKLFVEADRECQIWDKEAAESEGRLFAAIAIANGTRPPEPLRPHPAGPLGEEAWLTRIAMEGE